GDPRLIGRVGVELPIQEVLGHRQVVVGVGDTAELPRRLGPGVVVAHELGDRVDAAVVSAVHQLGMSPRAAVAGVELGMDGPDLHEQGVVALLPGAGGAVAPGVVAGRRDVQRLTEPADGPLLAVLFDEAEGHSASRAKSAVAFFRMSRSARSRWFSVRRRRSSSSNGGSLPCPGKAWLPWASSICFQVRRRVSWTPNERAASATE